MNLEVTCDFCPRLVEARDVTIIEARPSPRLMCEVCKERLEGAAALLQQLADEELMRTEPATRLVC